MKKIIIILFSCFVLFSCELDQGPSPYYIELDENHIYRGEISYHSYWPRYLWEIPEVLSITNIHSELYFKFLGEYEMRQVLTANLKDHYIKEKLTDENIENWWNHLNIDANFNKTHNSSGPDYSDIFIDEFEFSLNMFKHLFKKPGHRIIYFKKYINGVEVVYFMMK